ncbi:MAG: 50S ribosomal protein L11 methyltransferase [Cyclobacteriaceae bacterium]|nr:50S ribosomal protein L11 methyltransferase [Cyclobacteriaceae bacterium]
MSYLEFTINCNPTFTEILIAEFSELGFDTFQETEAGFITFLESEFDKTLLNDLKERYAVPANFSYTQKETIKQNWNRAWEKNYDPIIIDDTCVVKAPFHTNLPTYPIELIITPKMSFGTGHHETTHLMLTEMLTLDFKKKKVMDVGTGTGVLAILAKKQKAQSVLAFDIDDWCVENTVENAGVNGVVLEVKKASIENIDLKGGYDIVLANINKNVLISQMNYYKKSLNAKGGTILLSGFYKTDLKDIIKHAKEVELNYVHHKVRNNWTMARFKG